MAERIGRAQLRQFALSVAKAGFESAHRLLGDERIAPEEIALCGDCVAHLLRQLLHRLRRVLCGQAQNVQALREIVGLLLGVLGRIAGLEEVVDERAKNRR
ncbi:MAG TPA: hypothetical protein VNR51_11830, partial [Hyphomicrobium sp.]|nr:hypothetical protein [Hyphomicrobium sp.]